MLVDSKKKELDQQAILMIAAEETKSKYSAAQVFAALVKEMREPDPDGKHEERVVTTLTKAFLWVRDAPREEAQP